MLKQVQKDRIETKDEIATGTTCPRNGEEGSETRTGLTAKEKSSRVRKKQKMRLPRALRALAMAKKVLKQELA